MSKADEKTTELMKKAKDFIPDGGYSEKELNLAFFMFIKGYHQAEKDLEPTLEDVGIILNAFLDFCIENNEQGKTKRYTDKEYCQEVLKRFKKLR
jgi:hypothetical protein